MTLRVRLTLCTICAVSLVAAIAIFQSRAADADNRQPAATATRPAKQPAPASTAKDAVYLEFTAPKPSTQSAAQKVRDALQKPITVQFKETPLKDAVNFIAAQCGIKATLNLQALNEEGIADDEPVTLTRKQPAPATAVLRTVLEPLNLTITIENERLSIITEIVAEETLDLRLYGIGRLIKSGVPPKALVEIVRQETSGPWMKIDGTGGTIDRFENLLVISSTEKVHAETKILLEVLERIATGKEKTGIVSLHMIPADRKVFAALSKQVSGEFQKTPLTDVAAFLGNLTRIDILIDEVALSEEGLTANEPMTGEFKNVSLKAALKQLLGPHNLTYVIQNGALELTTEIVSEEMLDTFAFNIRDFTAAGYDPETLIASLRKSTSGPWMETDGTGGTFNDKVPGFLIIRQTYKVLDECTFHLENLRTVLKQSTPDGKLPKSTADPKLAGLTLHEYTITSFPIEEVRDALPKFVATDSWKSAGGRGELAIIESKIIVRQTREVHQEIDQFLQSIGEYSHLNAATGGLGLGAPNFGKGVPGGGLFQVK